MDISIAETWNLRLATLATVGASTAYLLLGAGIVQSDTPRAAACIVAGGMGLMAYSAMLGGVGLLASWVLAVTPRDREVLWESRNAAGSVRRLQLKAKTLRSVMMMFAVIGIASSLIMTLSTMVAGTSVAHQIANGKCTAPIAPAHPDGAMLGPLLQNPIPESDLGNGQIREQ